jgi:tryptophan halogenase
MSDNWDDTRSFLALHYRFNNRLDTPFWKHCRANVPLHGVTELVDFYRVHGPSRLPRGILIRENNLFGLEGYLALLVGMGVPYEQAYEPANEEWRRWQTHKRRIADMAERAASVREALAAMRNPHSDRRSAVVAD